MGKGLYLIYQENCIVRFDFKLSLPILIKSPKHVAPEEQLFFHMSDMCTEVGSSSPIQESVCFRQLRTEVFYWLPKCSITGVSLSRSGVTTSGYLQRKLSLLHFWDDSRRGCLACFRP